MLSDTTRQVCQEALKEFEHNHHAAGLPGVMEARAALAELEALPPAPAAVPTMASSERWEPVEDGWYDIEHVGKVLHDRIVVDENGSAITINADYRPSLALPDDLRLCRRVEGAPAVPDGYVLVSENYIARRVAAAFEDGLRAAKLRGQRPEQELHL